MKIQKELDEAREVGKYKVIAIKFGKSNNPVKKHIHTQR